MQNKMKVGDWAKVEEEFENMEKVLKTHSKSTEPPNAFVKASLRGSAHILCDFSIQGFF